jgi:putative membrane protein insertion efficiency factor
MSSPVSYENHENALRNEQSFLGRFLGKLTIGLIWLYQRLISPILPASCRFYPSCSQYAKEAVDHHGFMKGSIYTVKRIGKCHPFHPGGLDPVPGKVPAEEQQ